MTAQERQIAWELGGVYVAYFGIVGAIKMGTDWGSVPQWVTAGIAVAPIELAVFLIEMDLFRRVRDALRDSDSAIPAVEVGPLDRTVVNVGDAHVGPIDMTRPRIHDDAVGEMAISNNSFAVGTVEIHRVNAVAAQFEKE
jgi:hypothetical protein